MNNRIIRTADGRAYHCAECPYRSRETDFCGFCMRKILDEMKPKKNDVIRQTYPPKKDKQER